jgi:Fe-S-cluster-containing dehydrogenase component
MPTLTKACNLCEERVTQGKLPSCVQHCQAWCLYYGEAEELVGKFDGRTRWSLLSK